MEQELIHECQQGNKSSFGKLVTPYLQDAFSLSFSILKSKQLAEDAVQNTLLEVYKNIMLKKEIRNFKSWFLTMVVSRSLDLTRKRQRESSRIAEADHLNISTKETPLVHLLDHEKRSAVVNAVLSLPTKLRAVITLHYFQDFTIQEIAEMLDVKEGTIKSRLFRARLTLNHILSKNKNILRLVNTNGE
jgi:RNA polymerase sigma factor (sigma-70 family)